MFLLSLLFQILHITCLAIPLSYSLEANIIVDTHKTYTLTHKSFPSKYLKDKGQVLLIMSD